jgi:uncharacterized membrane protein
MRPCTQRIRQKHPSKEEVTVFTLQIIATVVLGLMCGSELNVAAFGHPALNRQSMEAHIPVRSEFARVLGRVMPFWMGGSTLLNLLLVLLFQNRDSISWRLYAVALAIQIVAVVFSLIGPVPINNRIAKWTPASLPADWKKQEQRWDFYHWSRTCGLILAFVLLAIGISLR